MQAVNNPLKDPTLVDDRSWVGVASECAQAVELVRRNTLALDIPLGSSLSCVEILTALFLGRVLRLCRATPRCQGRDRFLLSKGHGSGPLYVILAALGYFDHIGAENALRRLGMDGALLSKHPETWDIPGIDFPSGALGFGLGIAAGMAAGLRRRRSRNVVYVLLGDGECDRGPVWEAADLIAKEGLTNVVPIIDANGLSYSGRVDIPSLIKRWVGLGYRVAEVDGHNVGRLVKCMRAARSRAFLKGASPSVIVARTIKGRGLEHLEGKIQSHEAQLDPSARPPLDMSRLRKLIEVLPRWGHRCVKKQPIRLRVPRFGALRSIPAAIRDVGLDLAVWANKNPNLVVVCADVQRSMRIGSLKPATRLMHLGLREQCALAVSAGLAATGFRPVVCAFDAFLLGAIQEIKCLLAIPQLPVVILASHSGVGVGKDGTTHHSIETPAAIEAIPNCYSFEPSDRISARAILRHALLHGVGPSYIRLARQVVPPCRSGAVWRISDGVRIAAGKPSRTARVLLLASGALVAEAVEARELLLRWGVSCVVFDLFSTTLAGRSGLLTQIMRDNAHSSAFLIRDAYPVSSWQPNLTVVGIDAFMRGGSTEFLYRSAGVDAEGIAHRVRESLGPTGTGVRNGGMRPK